MGALRVKSASSKSLWSKAGDQGDAWHRATLLVPTASFTFEAERGYSYKSDAAIDEVTVICIPTSPPSPASPSPLLSPPTVPPPPLLPP
eukprot:624413-Prymnesium_polylepis.1